MDNDLLKFVKCDIFTPDKMSELMASKLGCLGGNLLEPSVGTGDLLKFIDLGNFEKVDAYELKEEHLNQITNAKINKYNVDFLKAEITSQYDNIILNPPYIRIQDLSIDYRKYLKLHFNELNTGLVDIYYAFILKCIHLLKETGKMVSITPNSYLYNKSSLALRKYLFQNHFVEEIIDFNHEKVFKNASVYCCITVFSKTPKTHLVYNNNKINYEDINIHHSLFNIIPQSKDAKTLQNMCKISNGIATLRDAIFVHKTKLFDEPCWENITNGSEDKYIIYPYTNGIIIKEDVFKLDNPLTYEYLLKNKDELSKRDKGHKKYPEWFAFGRSQSIKKKNQRCIFMPCFINPIEIKTILRVREPILYQGCLCIEPNNSDDIHIIIQSIINNIEFIRCNSSKRSGGWINISSRVLYQISIDESFN